PYSCYAHVPSDIFRFSSLRHHPDLHSFPTRRSSDLLGTGSSLAAPPAPTNEYTIGPEDILDVTVWNNAGLSRTVPVRPDGKISLDRKSTRLNSSHQIISYAVFCLTKKK